ncbi:MAG TPA: MFS transporter [Bryobacteraceae bacterium]|jgi:MFS family permease|nr:MFS transporter [Bryobacteraceae bacterium]
MDALHLREQRIEPLLQLSESDWRAVLDFCDRSRLTLPLRSRAREHMPEWVRERTDRDAEKNRERLRGIAEVYRTVAQRLAGRVEFIVLKGITQAALTGGHPEDRVQYDLDLYTPRESVLAARDLLLRCGYESFNAMEDFPTDHLPVLVRRTGWEWRSDFFDPEIPTSIELHFRFWNAEFERLRADGVEEFWDRRLVREIAGVEMPMLHPVDALAYTALHLLKHLLEGSVSAFHVYELGQILEAKADDEAFWRMWQRWHSLELQRLQAVSFELARSWFGCRVTPAAETAIELLPSVVHSWFDTFVASPFTRQFRPNKDELWLHMSLLDLAADRWSVARRRLFPARLPGPVDAVYLDERQMSLRRRWLKRLRYGRHVLERVWHHAATLPRTASSGTRWWSRTSGPGGQFWKFLGAASLFNFALFIFVLLYNLHLLDLGYREDLLGVISGSSTAGSVVGTIPAAFLARRLGLRNSLVGCFALTACITALRVVVVARSPLIALAFLSGLVFAVWAVLMAPIIAQAVPEKRRPATFSIFFATMIGIGIAGGSIGGRLPLWVHGKKPALLLAAALVAFAVWPAARLRLGTPVAAVGTRVYPRGGFLLRFLAPFALWHLATGSFNPFFNAYFAHLRFPVERIGLIFSGAQLTQVITVLLAPLLIARTGLVGGIVWMMMATALGMAGLAVQPPGAAAAFAYTTYVAFQWMSEPGMNTLLMNHVDERERGGASALMYLVAFSAQAVAAFGAGALLPHVGYGVVIGGAALVAASAAGLLRVLVGAPFAAVSMVRRICS